MGRKWLPLVPTAGLALVVLAACGPQQAAQQDVTRAPAANAPATAAATVAATAEATATATAAATEEVPAALASPAAASPVAATPVAATPITAAATPVEVVSPGAAATPAQRATPMATAVATETTATAAASPSAATPAGRATPGGATGGGAAQQFTVTSVDIAFEPKELTIPANQDVTVRLPNQGAAPHNFSIDALGIDVDLPPGSEEQTVINAPAGTYEYYCNVPGHKQAGMVGTLTVE